METSKHSLASYIGDLKHTLYLTHRCTHVSMLNDNTLLIAADKENAEKRISLDKIRRLVIIGHIGNVDSEVLYRLEVVSLDIHILADILRTGITRSDKEFLTLLALSDFPC